MARAVWVDRHRFGGRAAGLVDAAFFPRIQNVQLVARATFLVLFSLVALCVSILSKGKIPLQLISAFSAAYLLHLVCDSISGGVNWLYPYYDVIWGEYWVSPMLWIPLDVVCLLLCYYLFRLRPLLEKRRQSA